MRLEGKVAIITGAASGIGRATAIRFAQEGARVLGADVNKDGLEVTVATIRDAGGIAEAVPCDVSVEDDVRRLVQTALDLDGRLDVMVNNAGIGNPPLPLGEMPLEEWERTLATNLRGVFLGCKHAAPVMARQGGGSIVNTASVAGVLGARLMGPYNAAKGGVVTLTKNVAVDYGESGVRCNCVCPGLIDTPLAQPIKEWGLWEQVVQRHTLRRAGRPEEVAAAILFLASDDASFITGTALFVDGGLTAH